ncbi:MAG: DNA-processing protein DprA [Pontibacterium sp.]
MNNLPSQLGFALAPVCIELPALPSWAYWLAASGVDRLGPTHLQTFISAGITPRQLLAQPQAALEAMGLSAKAQQQVMAFQQQQGALWQRINETEHWLSQSADHHVIAFGDEDYPSSLAQINDAPAVLFVVGSIAALSRTQVAVIGSRNASLSGQRHARQFAKGLSEAGIVVTSGLALGIDACAHQGALDAAGPTVAVLATGADQIYPRRHQGLAEEIVAFGGAIVTESPLGTPPIPHLFPRRNRIISGLSLGTLVVEAGLKSGSLTTAQHTLNQGREVFALPCGLDNANSAGNLQLLRQGALLVTTPMDIITEVMPMMERPVESLHCACNVSEAKDIDVSSTAHQVLALLTDEPTSGEQLSRELGLSSQDLSVAISELELEGLVSQRGDSIYRA